MSGPPYPRSSPSSAIGSFAIGISPIGTIGSLALDPWATVLSQYANSPRLDALITAFAAALDQSQNMESLYDLIWNVQTATGYGLDVLGRIVGVSRTLKLPEASTGQFGFQEAGDSWTGFNQGSFNSGGNITPNLVLSDADFRVLVLAKAAGNISDGSIRSVNQILMSLFSRRGPCYVIDNLDMSLTYRFEFNLTPAELAIIELSGVLPSPAGVAINISQP